MKHGVKVALALVLVLSAFSLLKAGDPPKGDAAKMQGTWAFVTHEMDGKKAPEDALKNMTVTIKGNTFTVKNGDQVIQAGTQKLDGTKKPRTIDATITEGEGKGTKMLGIYELDGDTMKVCFDEKGKARPTAFKAAEGSGLFLAEVKRVKK